MKTPIAALVLVSLSLVSFVPAPGAAPEGLSAASAQPAVAQDADAEFMDKFRKAMKIGASDEMNRLVRTNQNSAMNQIIKICEFIADTPNDKSEEEIAALRKAWEAVFQTDFVGQMYEYFSLMRPEIKAARAKLKTRYEKANADFLKAEAAKDKTKYGELAVLMNDLAESFSQIGDHFHASQAWLFAGRGFDEPLRGKDADLHAATVAYGKCLHAREKIGLKDTLYGQTKERHARLEKEGHGDPEKAAPGLGSAPADPGAVITMRPTFEAVPDLETWRRPIYSGDPAFQAWPGIYLRGTGSSTRFSTMEKGPVVHRVAFAEVQIDSDGDGTYEAEIPLTGNITPITIPLGSGDEARQWAFLTAIGQQRDTYNDIQPFNLTPGDQNMTIYIAPAGSVVGTIGEETVRIFDDNMDGIYGSDPILWNHIGMVDGASQCDLDSVVVGNAKSAQPWSEFLKVGEGWYRMEVDKAGTEIKATPVPEIDTGTLKLSMKGPKADFMVLKGQTGTFEKSFFDIAAKGGVEVPAGRYELYVGQVSKGKKDRIMKALVVPGKNTKVWTVENGKTTTVELGSPFGFEFSADQDDETVTVYGDSVAVVGKAGETYQRLWNCVTRPDVLVREAGKKRGGKGEGMRRPESQEQVGEVGFKYAWFPMDLTVPKKPGKPAEVQLVEKKNKLFGKIESDWKD